MCVCVVQTVISIKLHVREAINVYRDRKLGYFALSLSSTHLPVTQLHGQPAVISKLELLAGLEVADDDGTEEPGGVDSDPRVVVPDPQILEAAQALPSGHDETVNTSSVKCDAWECPDVGLVLLSSQDELNPGLAACLVLGSSQN